jgi:hypothetical protein
MNDHRTPAIITIPFWVQSLGKMMAPVIITLAIGYARFVSLENKAVENTKRIDHLETIGENSAQIQNQQSGRINTMELKESILEKNISEGMVRIEATIKDIQIDMKELQKRPK